MSDNQELNLNSKKIYIVEDDVFLGQILSQRIAAETTSLTLFKNGEDALAAIIQNVPDIVVLDIFLPGMDGFKVLENMKLNDNTKSIPVLVVSNANEADKAKSMGVEFLLKALTTPDEIVEKVKSMLG
ncbi:MAG: response regulator [Patescibacteria group bacterium]